MIDVGVEVLVECLVDAARGGGVAIVADLHRQEALARAPHGLVLDRRGEPGQRVEVELRHVQESRRNRRAPRFARNPGRPPRSGSRPRALAHDVIGRLAAGSRAVGGELRERELEPHALGRVRRLRGREPPPPRGRRDRSRRTCRRGRCARRTCRRAPRARDPAARSPTPRTREARRALRRGSRRRATRRPRARAPRTPPRRRHEPVQVPRERVGERRIVGDRDARELRARLVAMAGMHEERGRRGDAVAPGRERGVRPRRRRVDADRVGGERPCARRRPPRCARRARRSARAPRRR